LEYFEIADIVDDIDDTLHPDNVCSTCVAHISNVTFCWTLTPVSKPLN
jgi:hypothetical protein